MANVIWDALQYPWHLHQDTGPAPPEQQPGPGDKPEVSSQPRRAPVEARCLSSAPCFQGATQLVQITHLVMKEALFANKILPLSHLNEGVWIWLPLNRLNSVAYTFAFYAFWDALRDPEVSHEAARYDLGTTRHIDVARQHGAAQTALGVYV